MMSRNKRPIAFIGVAALLLATLACRAATSLVAPDTPTPSPTATATPTLTPTPPPTFTPTVLFEAACPSLLSAILNRATSNVTLPGRRSDRALSEEGGISLVTYEVSRDRITGPRNEPVPDELKDERNDRAAHEAIWKYFAALIPPAERAQVSEFSIFTDGRGNHLAAVSPAYEDPENWGLHVDILDAESYYDLSYTLLHEQGHLLTLNARQVPPSKAIFKFPENVTIYKQEVAACPQFFTGQGCSEPDSYINQFFGRFWPDLYEEWQPIDAEEDEDTRSGLLEDFYETYEDQFLTDYSATSPIEDIAEAWTFFVLAPRPELTSIAHEKILFFYEYPELVDLRTQILKQICVEFPR